MGDFVLSGDILQKNPLLKLQQLGSPIPKILNGVPKIIKRKGDETVVNMPLSQVFWSALQPSK